MLGIPSPVPTHADQSHPDTFLAHKTLTRSHSSRMPKESASLVLANTDVSLKHGALTEHCRLTDSPARTNLALFIHRAVRLI